MRRGHPWLRAGWYGLVWDVSGAPGLAAFTEEATKAGCVHPIPHSVIVAAPAPLTESTIAP